jgi:hypothetical protein
VKPTTVRDAVFATTLVILSGVVAYDHTAGHRWPSPDAAPGNGAADGVALGKAYAPGVLSASADGWEAAAAALAAGQSVNECQKVLYSVRAQSLQKSFAPFAPKLSAVLPEGTEPRDDAHRAQVVAFWRAIARGLRGGR